MVDREHHVVAYDDDGALVARVADFVAASLEEGVRVVTISRPAHRRAVEHLLSVSGADPVRARGEGIFVALDADETMARFVVDGRPDPTRFEEILASLVPAGGPPVSVFGEIVTLLWERGEVAAALELESLWNATIATRPIRLLCGYPAALLADSDLRDVSRMCELHDEVGLLGAHPRPDRTTAGAEEVRSGVHLPVPAAVASVRRFVRDSLAEWGLDDMAGDVALVTSELATNAITHANSPFRTSLVRAHGLLRVSVEDGSISWPQLQHALPGDQDGRGMAIVATLSRRSGCDITPAGKVAWAELPL